jgi:hypothetical protein
LATVLDPRNAGTKGVTITILMPQDIPKPPVLSDSLNATPDWVGTLAAAQEFRMDSRYQAFWEYVDRIAADIKATFREDEVPPPVATYFKLLDRKV